MNDQRCRDMPQWRGDNDECVAAAAAVVVVVVAAAREYVLTAPADTNSGVTAELAASSAAPGAPSMSTASLKMNGTCTLRSCSVESGAGRCARLGCHCLARARDGMCVCVCVCVQDNEFDVQHPC
jgi:hypothetical protein